MKILFAIQGTGNGHLSRAMQIYPLLKQYGRIDVMLSGKANSLKPNFPVRYHYDGLGFAFGQKGGIDFIKTYTDARIWRFLKSVEEVPVRSYDLVINDFEPITAWACRLRDVPMVALSHQAALLKTGVPKPTIPDLPAELVLRHYAPAQLSVGFHFESYHPDVFTPVVKHQLYGISRQTKNHFTVYLPAFSIEKLVHILPRVSGMRWHIFARDGRPSPLRGDIRVFAVDADSFSQSMAAAAGVLCGAGFETPAEALHLGIPLLVIPMQGHYEQACNAAALENLGAGVIWKTSELTAENIRAWIDRRESIQMDYPPVIKPALERVMELYERSTKSESGHRKSLLALFAS